MYSSSTGYSKHNALLVNPTTQKESLEELMGLGIVLLRLCVAAPGILFGLLMFLVLLSFILKALEINHQAKILVEVEKSFTGRLLYLATSKFDHFSPKANQTCTTVFYFHICNVFSSAPFFTRINS